MKEMLTAVALVAFAACSGATIAPAPVVVAEVTLPTENLDVPEAERPMTLQTFFEVLREHVASGDIDAIEPMLFDFEPTPGEPFAPRILEGIRQKDPVGDWSFSLPALDVLIRHVDLFVIATDETPGASMYAAADPRMADLARLRVFQLDDAYVMMVITDEGPRLVFWEGLTSLTP